MAEKPNKIKHLLGNWQLGDGDERMCPGSDLMQSGKTASWLCHSAQPMWHETHATLLATPRFSPLSQSRPL
jgi:hypothetical protein